MATLSKNAHAYIGFTFIEPFDHALQHVLDTAIAVERALELMPNWLLEVGVHRDAMLQLHLPTSKNTSHLHIKSW